MALGGPSGLMGAAMQVRSPSICFLFAFPLLPLSLRDRVVSFSRFPLFGPVYIYGLILVPPYFLTPSVVDLIPLCFPSAFLRSLFVSVYHFLLLVERPC